MNDTVCTTPATEPIPECRSRIILFSLVAGFTANLCGALFAVNSTLFPSTPELAAALAQYHLWQFVVPFSATALLYILYVAPLFRATATIATYRNKILNFPFFYVLTTAVGWTTGFLQGLIIPMSVDPSIPLHDILLGNMGILGISFLSMAIGYYLFEYLNRTYWIPRLFNNKLEAYKDHLQPSIRAKFHIYYLGFSWAPTLFLGWIIIWIGSKHHLFSQAQYLYMATFVAFVAFAGWKITGIFSRLFQLPLLEARTATDRIANGSFDVNLTVHSNDELGVLSERINDMAGRLQGNANHIQVLNEELEQTQREVVFTMGAIGETRSKETGNHVKRVAEYSCVLALAYGLNSEQAELLKQASPMHDIGKVAIPDAILNKPGRLTASEFEVMKTHAAIGHDMLRHSNRALLRAAATVALQHHEKFDGSGYPASLAGEQIHIFGRITAIADVFDALGSSRVYKPAWQDSEIFALFREQRGRHFDPRLVDLFFENLDRLLAIRCEFSDAMV